MAGGRFANNQQCTHGIDQINQIDQIDQTYQIDHIDQMDRIDRIDRIDHIPISISIYFRADDMYDLYDPYGLAPVAG